MKAILEKVIAGEPLTEEESSYAMNLIMEGEATPAQIAALLTALRLKGETVDEITGFARVMRQKATVVEADFPMLLDTCGTGGDGSNTFNISTTAALVLAGAGVKIAKHGNRAATSKCGSADVLEKLGVNLELEPQEITDCLNKVGIGFLFAPALHKAMKHAIGPRRELGFRTVFNVLGPLTNPAGAKAHVLGVYSKDLTEIMASVLARLGVFRAFVVHGAGGLDEMSPAGLTEVSEVKDGQVVSYQIDPADYGFRPAKVSQLAGGTPEENAAITTSVLSGERGPRRDAVVLNAALGFMAAGYAEDFAAGVDLANKSIDNGYALKKLIELVEFTSQYKKKLVAGL
ncbi:anthranilate phosphoribosyltransferase [Desulfofarcimen acetoxidans DSM 771]|uniref:Anthranilate phosphoribosyltransferase n=1 Tax=Desulfofarcimen acetoxidans (strain ATCC 49208 / DSM 771 / KCTC 5769 / VKM B-1644 / 5575) TaxID=485916 RepID=C8W335_DESAS|nr:anthranilate phosphoribosyltransferase [Desulfofarcimen acetoxidans]ACV61802.1 anthranilate phosphoribosyltransferase [Desulfofarcimen acetoxidans DSM 771]